MKALTHNKDWFEFSMADLPTLFTPNEFVLLNRPNTPRLLFKSIRRGDSESGLFEGDIIEMDGREWLICYERGFYAIDSNYIIKHLYTLRDFKVLGTCSEIKSPVPINFRTKHLFSYDGNIFRLNDIIGAYEGKLLLRSLSEPVDVSLIKQECCVTYNGSRVYLGDELDIGTVVLRGGRITVSKEDKIIDIVTGEELYGYIS